MKAVNRVQTGLALIVGGVCVLFVAVVGLWVYAACHCNALAPGPA